MNFFSRKRKKNLKSNNENDTNKYGKNQGSFQYSYMLLWAIEEIMKRLYSSVV